VYWMVPAEQRLGIDNRTFSVRRNIYATSLHKTALPEPSGGAASMRKENDRILISK